jgi:hypothetical protein
MEKLKGDEEARYSAIRTYDDDIESRERKKKNRASDPRGLERRKTVTAVLTRNKRDDKWSFKTPNICLCYIYHSHRKEMLDL